MSSALNPPLVTQFNRNPLLVMLQPEIHPGDVLRQPSPSNDLDFTFSKSTYLSVPMTALRIQLLRSHCRKAAPATLLSVILEKIAVSKFEYNHQYYIFI